MRTPTFGCDGQILATALARGAAVATRNVRDFVGYDLQVIDPWV
jgi:predicted nucleic acid-binding protein